VSDGEAPEEIGPLVPMAVAFIGIGLSLLVALPFIDDELGAYVNLGAALFLSGIGAACLFAAVRKGEHVRRINAVRAGKKEERKNKESKDESKEEKR